MQFKLQLWLCEIFSSLRWRFQFVFLCLSCWLQRACLGKRKSGGTPLEHVILNLKRYLFSCFTAGVRELLMHWARSSSKFHASVRLAGAVWFERLRQYDYQSGNIGGCEHFNIKCRKQNNHFLCFQYSGGLAIPGWVYFFTHTSIISLEFLIFSLSVCFQCLPCELLQRVCAIFGCHVLLEIYWCRWTSNQFPRRRSVKNDTFIK